MIIFVFSELSISFLRLSFTFLTEELSCWIRQILFQLYEMSPDTEASLMETTYSFDPVIHESYESIAPDPLALEIGKPICQLYQTLYKLAR